MIPNPIVVRSAKYSDTHCIVTVEETVGGDTIDRIIELDEQTGEGFQRALQTHPFKMKQAMDDVLLFKGIRTPLHTEQKYLDLQVVNTGSRHDLIIEASDEAYALFETVLKSWASRMAAERKQ